MATPQQQIPKGLTMQIRRLFDATRDRVFAAWTDPDGISQWLCRAPGYNTEHLQFEARVGGRYLIRNTSAAGDIHNIRGEFREVQPPSKLVFTWGGTSTLASGATPPKTDDTLVVLEFFERGTQTEVLLTHYGLPSDEVRADHMKGWNICFDNLEAIL
jgi:uncharacterized protein YndB with AHSA1/START domain